MANGLLGKAALAATTFTTVAQVTPGLSGTVNIRLVNRSSTVGMVVQLAVCPSGYVDGAVPANADFIEPVNVELPPSGVLEETAFAVSSGEKIVAYSSTGNLTARVFGYLR